jgi:oxygen-independent coproporphyrinogen-3 oxidase
VGAILDAIGNAWSMGADAEITLEANPSSVEAGRFRGYREAGVNRVSLGVQALDDADLRALGRLHTAEEALAAIEVARATFARCSFDMIYARPGQTLPAWRAELAQALALAGRHLSLYQLTIEPETPFAALHARGKLRVPDSEMAHDLYELTQELTQQAGLPAYEISNHAAPGEECRHNLTYWRYGEYAGIGPGAHGRVVAVGGERHATATERQPERWVQRVEADGHGMVESVSLSCAEQADEALLMGLRLSEGLGLDRLLAVSGMRPGARAVSELLGRPGAGRSPGQSRHQSKLRVDRGSAEVARVFPAPEARPVPASMTRAPNFCTSRMASVRSVLPSESSRKAPSTPVKPPARVSSAAV